MDAILAIGAVSKSVLLRVYVGISRLAVNIAQSGRSQPIGGQGIRHDADLGWSHLGKKKMNDAGLVKIVQAANLVILFGFLPKRGVGEEQIDFYLSSTPSD